MATTTVLDLRRTDVRTNVLTGPYWISSAEVGITADDKAAILFSFPLANYPNIIILHEAVCQVTTLWAGGTILIDIGAYTLATDAVTTGGVATIVDIDEYIATAHITSGTAGYYFCGGSDWLTSYLLHTRAAASLIVPAATDVPCVAATITSSATITGGALRVHMKIEEVPLV